MPDIKHTRTDLNLPCFVMYCSMEDTDIDYYILKIIERALYHNYVSNEKTENFNTCCRNSMLNVKWPVYLLSLNSHQSKSLQFQL